MKLGDANYDSTVEQKRTELRGHKHTQLTEAECKQEIEAIVGGAKSSFEGEIIPEAAEAVNLAGLSVANTLGQQYAVQAIVEKHGGYITKSGRVMKGKPGRKLGSKNRPK